MMARAPRSTALRGRGGRTGRSLAALVTWVWLGTAGCGPSPLMADQVEVPLDGWSSEDDVRFHWDVVDTLLRHDMVLDVRHAQDYPFANLYLFLTYRYPNGKSRVDTVECTLADQVGRWRGSGFGDLVDQRFLLHRGITFPVKGRYSLDVAHGMRQDPLVGVSDVGLRLEASRQ